MIQFELFIKGYMLINSDKCCWGSTSRMYLLPVLCTLLGISLGVTGAGQDSAEPNLAVRFVCDGGNIFFPTYNNEDVCGGNLKLVVRNKDRVFPFAGGIVSVDFSANGCEDEDVETMTSLDVPQIEPNGVTEVMYTGIEQPTADAVSCEPGCLKVVMGDTVLAKKEVFPDVQKCHHEVDGDVRLSVEVGNRTADPKQDEAGNYYVELGDFISKIELRGNLILKQDKDGNAMPYNTLAFLRLPGNTHMGWPTECDGIMGKSPEAGFGDATFHEFSTDEVTGLAEIFPTEVDSRVYVTGRKSACPSVVCGHSELVVYFDWKHHLDRFPHFDRDKCDNFFVRNVTINCRIIPQDVIQNTQALSLVPDVTSNGDYVYALSCKGYNWPQFNVFHAQERVWRPMMELWSPHPKHVTTVIGMKRVQQMLNSLVLDPEICNKSNLLDQNLDDELQHSPVTENCKDKLNEYYAESMECDDSPECSEPSMCCDQRLLNQTILACGDSHIGKALKKMVMHNETDKGQLIGEATKMDCPGHEFFDMDDALDEATFLKGLLDDIHEGKVEEYQGCKEYPDEPVVCAQRVATFMFKNSWRKLWNADIERHLNNHFEAETRNGHTDQGVDGAAVDYLQHCSFPDVTESKARDQHYTTVMDGGIWHSRRNYLQDGQYCWSLVAVHRCPACEEYWQMPWPGSGLFGSSDSGYWESSSGPSSQFSPGFSTPV